MDFFRVSHEEKNSQARAFNVEETHDWILLAEELKIELPSELVEYDDVSKIQEFIESTGRDIEEAKKRVEEIDSEAEGRPLSPSRELRRTL